MQNNKIFGGALAGSLAVALLAATPADAASKHRHKARHDDAERKEKLEPVPAGPLTIVISIDRQKLTVFDDGKEYAQAPVSTGMRGHLTPLGVFSVIEKERFHRSNLYSGAPMPFMQRITWSGVAMHEGVLPGYPASHGCIRMPGEFARKLYRYTRVGARVIVTHQPVAPVEVADMHLFTLPPKVATEPKPVGKANEPKTLQKSEIQPPLVRTAETLDPNKATDAADPAAASVMSPVPPAAAPASGEPSAVAPIPAVDATKDMTKDASKDAAKDASAEPGKEAGADKTPATDKPQPETADTAKPATTAVGDVSADAAGKSGVGKTRDDAVKTATVAPPPAAPVQAAPATSAVAAAAADAAKETTATTGKTSATDAAAKDAAKEVAKDAAKEAAKEPAKEAAKEAAKEPTKAATADTPTNAAGDAKQTVLLPPEPVLPKGPVSVFISRKTGKLYVRKGYQPLFEAPVVIRQPEQAFGTHVFTAMGPNADGTGLRWTAVSIPSGQPRAAQEERRQHKRGRHQEVEAPKPEPVALPRPSEVLERIEIPPDVVERIARMLTPEASLIVSDNRISEETGKYTDFIILTR